MRKIITTIAIAVAVSLTACKGTGNPEGAAGANDKPDSTAFDKETQKNGRPEATQPDTSDIGPGKDKTHATDSEDKSKHR